MEINRFIENKKMYYILPSWFADLHLHYTKLKVLIFQYDTRNIRFVEIELRIYERKQKKRLSSLQNLHAFKLGKNMYDPDFYTQVNSYEN